MEQGGFDPSIIQTYIGSVGDTVQENKNSLKNLSTEQLIQILNNL